MKNRVRLVIAGALVVGTSLAVVVPGGIASAKAKQVTGSCTGLSGGESMQNLTGCGDPSDTGGSGTTVTNITAGTYVTTWATDLTSSGTVTYKEKFGKADKCPAAPPGETSLAEATSTNLDTGGTATDLIGTKKLKSTTCAYTVNSDDSIVINNFPGKTVPF